MASEPNRGARRGAGRRTAGSQRDRILELALELMAERGVRGMGMRDLAAAAGCNVATLYHYFPSKRDLLEAVLSDRGYLEQLEGPPPRFASRDLVGTLAALLEEAWLAMVDVEDYVRLMLGEALRGDLLARDVGSELLERTEATLARWLAEVLGLPEARASALARVLRGVLVGAIVEYLTGILGTSGAEEARQALGRRAREVAVALGSLELRERPGSPLQDPAEGSQEGGVRTPAPRRGASGGAGRRRGSPGRS